METVWGKFVESGYIWFVLAIVAWLVIPSVWKDWKHSRALEFEARGKIISRRMGSGMSGKNVYEIYYGTFETDFGQILELQISQSLYYLLKDGTWGHLQWKGNKLEDFQEEKHEL